MKTDSSSGRSSSSDVQQRKQRRMQSNRESARRSRMKKQKHLDDLAAEVALLSKQNSHISNSINAAADHCVEIEAHNSVLRAQVTELSQRLRSLDQILTHAAADEFQIGDALWNNCWNLVQPITAAAAQAQLFEYY
ncbi:bZIP transcription factor 53-like [Salvia divinorum]|uniref:BZIP transcription factor 53-like n=1 Tax=Salvia divinorum TaxID=28513 RepID=A0ABD1I161_SALDI